MSAANSAAKKRRAGFVDAPVPPPPPPPQPQQSAGLTIHQVVNLFDKRLNVLEKTVADFVSTYMEDRNEIIESENGGEGNRTQEEMEAAATSSKEMMDEFGARFEILVEEIDTLKNTIITLQTYTLSVNKMLLESNGKFRNIPNIAMNK